MVHVAVLGGAVVATADVVAGCCVVARATVVGAAVVNISVGAAVVALCWPTPLPLPFQKLFFSRSTGGASSRTGACGSTRRPAHATKSANARTALASGEAMARWSVESWVGRSNGATQRTFDIYC